MAEWPWRYRSRWKVIARHTPPYVSDHACQIRKESIQNCMCYRADTAKCDIFQQLCCKVVAKLPWRYRPRSKVIMRDTPSNASDHLCLIHMKRIHPELQVWQSGHGMWDGRTDRQTDRVKPLYLPQQRPCAEGIKMFHRLYIYIYINMIKWLHDDVMT